MELLKPVNTEKLVVVPDPTDNNDVLQSEYDTEFPVDSQPTKTSELIEIAYEFAKYLLKRPQYTDYLSEACNYVYNKLPVSRELLNKYRRLRGLIFQCPFLSLHGGIKGGTFQLKSDKPLYDQLH